MKFKVVWINLLFTGPRREYDADLKNGKRAEFQTRKAAEAWARKQNRSVVNAMMRSYRIEPING